MSQNERVGGTKGGSLYLRDRDLLSWNGLLERFEGSTMGLYEMVSGKEGTFSTRFTWKNQGRLNALGGKHRTLVWVVRIEFKFRPKPRDERGVKALFPK